MASWHIQFESHETTIEADTVESDSEHSVLLGSRGGDVIFIAPLYTVVYARQLGSATTTA